MLILILGLPATGKTTFAIALAEALGAVHLNSDKLRMEMGLEGQYDAASKKKVYRALLEQAETALQQGKEVIVDSTFYKRSIRRPYEELAQKTEVPIKWIRLVAPESTIRERMNAKRLYSEADFEVYQKIRAQYEPLEHPHLSLDTEANSLDEMVAEAKRYLTEPDHKTDTKHS